MFTINVDYNLKPLVNKYSSALSSNGVVISNVATKILKDIEPYVPRDTGDLIQTGKYVRGLGIEWDTPYAVYMYNGVSSSGAKLRYNQSTGSPLAGPVWDKRYLADNEAEIFEYANKLIKNM